jgi:predicted permease
MRRLRVLVHRLRSIVRGSRADDDLSRELALHVEMLEREGKAGGAGEAEARRAARLAFGSPDLAYEQCRDERRVGWIEDLVKDTRYAARLLARSPAFACTSILSLALGIGANAAIFSLVDAVLLRTMPVSRPAELVFLQVAGSESTGGAPPYECFRRIRETAHGFAGLAGFATDEIRVEVDGRIEQVFGQVASGNYFDVLGVDAIVGRVMIEADERLDPPVAVISYGYWQRRFGADPGAVGKTLVSDGRTYEIVGVTAPEFKGLQPGRQVDVTLPITQNRALIADAGAWWFDAVGRIRAGGDVAQAARQADAVFQAFTQEHVKSIEMRSKHFDRLTLTPASRGTDRLRERFSTSLHVVSAIGAIVLIVACANLGGLLVARGESRAREMAIRVATGASTGRLARQLLAETMLMVAAGTGAGLLVAVAVLRGLERFFAIGRNPIVLDIRYDWTLAAFAAGLALIAGLLTGLWPAFRAGLTDPQSAMKGGEVRTTGSRRATRAGRVLITGQMAMSVVLLVAAALMAQTMANLSGLDLGFRGTRVLTLSLELVMPRDEAAQARPRFLRQTLDRVRSLAGVDAASLSVLTPLSGRDTGRLIAVAGYDPASEVDRSVRVNHVSEDYFTTFGIDIVEGRAFTARDADGALKVAIVNQAARRVYFAGRSPIGETIGIGDTEYRVVGVVRDHKHRSLREPAPPFVFLPVWQPADGIGRVTLAVASGLPPAQLARAVTAEAHAVHPRTLVSDVVDVQRQIDATLLGERLLSTLAVAFAALALILVTIGLYGVLSYWVARRRREFGVRMALGAGPQQIVAAVILEVLTPLVLGVLVGVPAAVAVSRLAEALLFGVQPLDVLSYIAAAAILTAVSAVASWIPARRACAIHPSEALRSE